MIDSPIKWVRLYRQHEKGRFAKMIRSFMTAAASAAVLTLSSTTFAGGTGEEAKAMLTKAVAAVKADEAKGC